MDKTRIAVILVNYNGLEDTRECIDSIIHNNIRDVSIVVVDNASIRNETEILKKEYKDIKTIRSEINGGFSFGNNLGIKWAIDNKYNYILLLNNDTVIDRDMIRILAKESSESVVTVPTMLYYSDPYRIWFGGCDIRNCA